MPDHLGDDMRKTKVEENKEEKEIKGMFFNSFYPESFFLNFLLSFHSFGRKGYRNTQDLCKFVIFLSIFL